MCIIALNELLSKIKKIVQIFFCDGGTQIIHLLCELLVGVIARPGNCQGRGSEGGIMNYN